MENLIKREYEGQEINFFMTNVDAMVNATEMAKVFNKRIDVFLKTTPTGNFIESLIKSQKFRDKVQRYLHLEVEVSYEDNYKLLYDSVITTKEGKNGGTYFCRPLAIKFAAWLNSDFEAWVYNTIDELMSGDKAQEIFDYVNYYPVLKDQRSSFLKKVREQLKTTKYAEIVKDQNFCKDKLQEAMYSKQQIIDFTFTGQLDAFNNLEDLQRRGKSIESDIKRYRITIEEYQQKINKIYSEERISHWYNQAKQAKKKMDHLLTALKY